MNNENSNEEEDELVIKWFNKEVGDGENTILVYPNLQIFRQIYTNYFKDQLVIEGDKEEEQEENSEGEKYNKKNDDSKYNNKQSKSKRRIILVAPFYETTVSVKHHLQAFGVENTQRFVDDGSLVLVDAYQSFFPDINGLKKLIDSLSERARKEGRAGVTAIVDMGPFFMFGGDGSAKQLINYEASLAPKTQDGNVKGISCYHRRNYDTLTKADKEEISQGKRKKLFEVKERNSSNTRSSA
jgi:hypothetical protein